MLGSASPCVVDASWQTSLKSQALEKNVWVTVGRVLPLDRRPAGVPPAAAHVGKVLPNLVEESDLPFWKALGQLFIFLSWNEFKRHFPPRPPGSSRVSRAAQGLPGSSKVFQGLRPPARRFDTFWEQDRPLPGAGQILGRLCLNPIQKGPEGSRKIQRGPGRS